MHYIHLACHSVIFTHRFASRSQPPLLASEALHSDCLFCKRITTAPSQRPWRTLCFTEVLNYEAQDAWECYKHSDKVSPDLLLQYLSSSEILRKLFLNVHANRRNSLIAVSETGLDFK
jgi:hypothetical protein